MAKLHKNYPILEFKSQRAWRTWLVKNHQKSSGLWIRIYKKDSEKQTVSPAEALDECLCFGWIDSLRNAYDEISFLQKYTPRKPKGLWSKRNREHVQRLIQEKKMTPRGLAEIEAAKKDGRWDQAYDSPKNAEVPEDFLKLLDTHKKAKAFFQTLNRSNLYAIAWRLQTAKKPETRQKRMELIFKMMKEGKKFH